MAVFYSDGFEVYSSEPKPKPEFSVIISPEICKIAYELGIKYRLDRSYVVFQNEQDFATIQFFI